MIQSLLQPPRTTRLAFAVWRRNVLVWRRLLGPALLMNLGEPLLYLLGLGYGLGNFVQTMDGLPYLAFLASGILASAAMTTASFEGMYSVFTRMVPQRTYESLLATPLTLDDILAGELLWCATKAAISGTAILFVAAMLGLTGGWSAVWVVPVVFLIGLTFAGPAMAMSALAGNYDFFNYYFVLLITPMLLVSGVFYPLDSLPGPVQDAVQFLPLAHAVALTRPLLIGLWPVDAISHLLVLMLYAAAGFYAAVILARRRLLR